MKGYLAFPIMLPHPVVASILTFAAVWPERRPTSGSCRRQLSMELRRCVEFSPEAPPLSQHCAYWWYPCEQRIHYAEQVHLDGNRCIGCVEGQRMQWKIQAYILTYSYIFMGESNDEVDHWRDAERRVNDKLSHWKSPWINLACSPAKEKSFFTRLAKIMQAYCLSGCLTRGRWTDHDHIQATMIRFDHGRFQMNTWPYPAHGGVWATFARPGGGGGGGHICAPRLTRKLRNASTSGKKHSIGLNKL